MRLSWFKDENDTLAKLYDSRKIQLTQLREAQKEESSKFSKRSATFVSADVVRERVSFITRRNKPRTILVVYYKATDNVLATTLLNSNSNAVPFFANSLEAGVQLLKAGNSFDMIYAVMPMEETGGMNSGRGPCFFSLDHPGDDHYRSEKPRVVEMAEKLRPHIGGAELIVVCGQAMHQCPIAQTLFEQMLHQSGEHELRKPA